MTTPVAHKLAAADARRLAAARAARAAASSRRAAAAKRRVVLLSALGVFTITGWVLSSLTTFTWVVPAAMTAVTIGFVELGRRAARDGVRVDATLAEAVRAAESRLAGSSAPVASKIAAPAPAPAQAEESAAVEAAPATSSLRIEIDPATAADTSSAATGFAGSAKGRSRASAESADSGWTPVPVPPPAYALKATAPRRLVAPIKVGEEPSPVTPSDSVTEFMDPVSARSETANSVMEVATPPAARPGDGEPATTGSLNVQEVLARRRAVG